jgi:hypothetical protein
MGKSVSNSKKVPTQALKKRVAPSWVP